MCMPFNWVAVGGRKTKGMSSLTKETTNEKTEEKPIARLEMSALLLGHFFKITLTPLVRNIIQDTTANTLLL